MVMQVVVYFMLPGYLAMCSPVRCMSQMCRVFGPKAHPRRIISQRPMDTPRYTSCVPSASSTFVSDGGLIMHGQL